MTYYENYKKSSIWDDCEHKNIENGVCKDCATIIEDTEETDDTQDTQTVFNVKFFGSNLRGVTVGQNWSNGVVTLNILDENGKFHKSIQEYAVYKI